MRYEIKKALISILIGACITFITVFLEGLLDFLKNNTEQLTGASVGMVVYLIRGIKNS